MTQTLGKLLPFLDLVLFRNNTKAQPEDCANLGVEERFSKKRIANVVVFLKVHYVDCVPDSSGNPLYRFIAGQRL